MNQTALGGATWEPGRIAGLDAWRALLMAAGLFVHGSLWLRPAPLFTVIGDASQAFRMGAFFAIAGLLTALALSRRAAAPWLGKRLLQLGVPALFGITALSPLIFVAVATSHRATLGWPLLPFEWHHLWFLVALMLYSLVAVVLDVADKRLGLIARLDGHADAGNGRLTVLVTATASAALLAAALPLLNVLVPAAHLRSFGNAQLIAGYLPMFLLGFVLARADRIRNGLIGAQRLGIAICLGTAAAYGAVHLLGPLAPLAPHVRFMAAALCPPAAFLLILRSALAIRRVPAVVRHVSAASYTIYVLHYPLSVLINTHFAGGVEPHLAYLLSVLASGSASFAVHVLAVQRWPALALLLNGKVARREPSRAATLADRSSVLSARADALPPPPSTFGDVAPPRTLGSRPRW